MTGITAGTGGNKIFAWGNGTSGQLGDGERSVKNKPVEVKLPQELSVEGSDADVADVVNIVGVACGSRHSFIWTDTGQAYSFGNNFYAQLGYDFQRADFKEHQSEQHKTSETGVKERSAGQQLPSFVRKKAKGRREMDEEDEG
ncbi:E3 ISG15--protein ligase Herc6 [Collichthys lucidus]|uniref:E3 ISG15--protein ligase Herc6 n=1 Tax=Collichthys lucidus TaxID=240159 RepID=A0A4U5UW35_COLLU|nr:E3 ISG15--protein ligase Herc6 [Collichthys lucidus]